MIRFVLLSMLLVTPIASAQEASQRSLFDQTADGRVVIRGQNCERGPASLFCWNGGEPLMLDLSEPLVTDRPDFTEASSTVGAGVAQLEFGYTYTTDKSSGRRSTAHSWGEPLLRIGSHVDWLEYRIALFPVTVKEPGRDEHSGTEDLYIGTKIGLTPQDELLPEMALILQANVPTGSKAFSSNRFEPGANLLYSWEINDCVSTGGSSQVNYLFDGSDRITEFAQSWTFAFTLSEKWGAYTEYFGLFPDMGNNEHYANGGFTYLIDNNTQFDIRAGGGLNNAADDFFFGVGLTLRHP